MSEDPLQLGIAEWCASAFDGRLTPAHDALAVVEEAGEVARAVLKHDQAVEGVDRKKLGVDHWRDRIRIEACDTLIALMSLAHNQGFDLLEETEGRFIDVKRRSGDA